MNTLNSALLIFLLFIMSGAFLWPLIYIFKQFRFQDNLQQTGGDSGISSSILERIVIVGALNLLVIVSLVYVGYENKVFLSSINAVFLIFIQLSVLLIFCSFMKKEDVR